MINDEEICLDRHPWWGPPESGNDDSCSGHIRAEASGIALARQEERARDLGERSRALKQRVDQAEDDAKQAVAGAKQRADETADRAQSKWAQMKADAAARREDIKAKIDKRADELDAKAAATDGLGRGGRSRRNRLRHLGCLRRAIGRSRRTRLRGGTGQGRCQVGLARQAPCQWPDSRGGSLVTMRSPAERGRRMRRRRHRRHREWAPAWRPPRSRRSASRSRRFLPSRRMVIRSAMR
jgi:hypothetical protein